MSNEKKVQIRNSTAEFLIFSKQAGEDSIEVRIADETVWLTQKVIGVLFEKGRSTITEHLRNIFETGELVEKAVCREFRHTAEDGKEYRTKFYILDAIIAVGYRVNSERATQFRQWATTILQDFAIRGYVLDKERLKNGAFFNKEYFDELLAEIREIRASERK
ncbi:MAG: RhuM family protein, partial [Veillonellales bacterium]